MANSYKAIPNNFTSKSIVFMSVMCLIVGLVLAETPSRPRHFFLQKRYPGPMRQMHCRLSEFNKIENCPHGSYIDDCERETCYKGVAETCNPRFDVNGNQYGLCASGLECVCGRCFGCSNDQNCEMELEFCNSNSNAIM